MTQFINPRKLAIKALHDVFNLSIKPKEVVDRLSAALESRDLAFFMEIFYGVLRHRDYLDWILRNFLRKPAGLSIDTINNLRTALYQIEYMRVPEWAAVNEAVSLEAHKSKSVVNAVLRSFLRDRDKIMLPQEESIDYIAIFTSHPKWLIKRWIKRFGFKETLELAISNNKIPPVTLRTEEPEKREYIIKVFRDKGIEAFQTEYSPAGIYLKGFPSILHDEIKKLKLFVQDEAAQLVTYLLNPLPHERVLDVCAAPGGKTTHIAQLMKDLGEIIAVEVDEKRIKSLLENINRLGLRSIKVIQSDIRDLKDIGLFDKILIDAPCSSTGVIRRNPDIKYRRKKKDLYGYKEKQTEIVNSSSRFLKKNGFMVYSVCSTEPEEGEEVIRQFLKDRSDFITVEGDYSFLEPFRIIDNGLIYYRTFPHRHNMDGFFMARLKKVEE